MNFLNFLTSGAGSNISPILVFNFNLQNMSLNNSNHLTRNLTIPIVSQNQTVELFDELKSDNNLS
jgi:hypothetical protein